MEKIDLAIVVLAVVAVVGSGVGLATYRPSVSTFQVTFSEEGLGQLDRGSATLPAPGASEDIDLTADPAEARNLTRVTIAVEASTNDPVLQDRRIVVEVTGPGGRTAQTTLTVAAPAPQGGSDDATLTVSVSDLPEGFARQARELQEVRDDVHDEYAHTDGTGTWTVDVSLEGSSQGLGGTEPSFDVSATLRATGFTADVRPEVPQTDVR